METFSDKITLLIIDKLLIAVIVIIVGYFVNKALESFKSRNNLMNEMTKLRIDKISELTYKIAEFEQNIFEQKFKKLEINIHRLLIEKLRKQRDNDIKTYNDNPKLVQELEKLFEKTKEKYEKEKVVIENDIKKLETERDKIFDSLELVHSKYRFWLGKDLSDRFDSFLKNIISKMDEEFKEAEDLESYTKQQKDLESQRIDVFNLLTNI